MRCMQRIVLAVKLITLFAYYNSYMSQRNLSVSERLYKYIEYLSLKNSVLVEILHCLSDSGIFFTAFSRIYQA